MMYELKPFQKCVTICFTDKNYWFYHGQIICQIGCHIGLVTYFLRTTRYKVKLWPAYCFSDLFNS